MQQLGYRNSTSGPPGGGPGGVGGAGYRPGQVVPPPYRAPPPGVPPGGSMFPPQPGPPHTQQQSQQNVQYSRLNISEQSMATGSPVNYRHTINHEHGTQVQSNLKQMLNLPKHQTLDTNTQSAALHHLRAQGFQNQGVNNDIYAGPDSMRNAANKLFSRSTNERNSMTYSGGGLPGGLGGPPGGLGGPPGGPPGQQYNQHQGLGPGVSQHSLNQLNQSPHQSLNQSLNQSMNQSMEMIEPKNSQSQGRLRAPSPDDATKRNSYANQSFRTALHSQNGQPGGMGPPGSMGPPGGYMGQQGQGQLHSGGHNQNALHGSTQNVQRDGNVSGMPKMPPQVPPKPGSRSASKDRSKEHSENSVLENELNNILHNSQDHSHEKNGPSGTPPLPPLSPSQSNQLSPQSSPDFRMKYKSSIEERMSAPRPDLIQNESHQQKAVSKSRGREERDHNNKRNQLNESQNRQGRAEPGGEDLASTVTGLDLESVIALQTDLTSDEELSTTIDLGDAQAIRRQLDGLENMYTEVLKLLGLRKFGRTPGGGDLKGGGGGPGGGPPGRRKMYGSMSSLPSVSSIGSRHLYSKDKRRDDRRSRAAGKDKTYNKRFQRLESHVVTLARSVAHLSSEMRTQHALIQDIETIKGEIQQLKMRSGPGPGHTNSLPRGGVLDPQEFFAQHPRVSAQTEQRVKKLTKFFGDEPPLLRLHLKNLGYEKYASIFEEAKIGMLELPYLSEDRLEKLGIPLGPRIRILQEAKIPYNVDGQNYNVYIL